MTTDDAIARCVYTVLTECDVKAKSTRLLVMQMLSNTSRTATDIAPYLPSTKMAHILMEMQDEWIVRREWMRHQPDPLIDKDAGSPCRSGFSVTYDPRQLVTVFTLDGHPPKTGHIITDKGGNIAMCGGPGLCEACDRTTGEAIRQWEPGTPYEAGNKVLGSDGHSRTITAISGNTEPCWPSPFGWETNPK